MPHIQKGVIRRYHHCKSFICQQFCAVTIRSNSVSTTNTPTMSTTQSTQEPKVLPPTVPYSSSHQTKGWTSACSTEAGRQEKEEAKLPGSDPHHGCGPPPDGGLRAWLIAAGGFAMFFPTLGFSNSFGVMAEYYLEHQLREKSTDDVAWIGSLSVFLSFFAGMLGGPLFDRFGSKVSLHLIFLVPLLPSFHTTFLPHLISFQSPANSHLAPSFSVPPR